MAFGGLGGIAGGVLVQANSIHPVGRYVAVGPNGQPDLVTPANNIFWRKSGPSDAPPGIEGDDNGALQYLSIASIAVPGNGTAEPNLLEACGDQGGDDEGTLVTGVPGAGEHGLPANFGRGRGRWRPGDEDYINVWFRLRKDCQSSASGGAIALPDVLSVTFVPTFVVNPPAIALGIGAPLVGDIEILIANRGLAAVVAGAGFPNAPIMNIEFMHTIQR